MDKSPDAFRTISEVADELDLPQHVLRFWETKFTQVKPMKRGGGRRYYRRNEVDLLRGIRHLLYTEGYTIKGVQKILKEQGPRYVIDHGGSEDIVEVEQDENPVESGYNLDETSHVRQSSRMTTANVTGSEGAGLSKKSIRNLKSVLNDLKAVRQLLVESK